MVRKILILKANQQLTETMILLSQIPYSKVVNFSSISIELDSTKKIIIQLENEEMFVFADSLLAEISVLFAKNRISHSINQPQRARDMITGRELDYYSMPCFEKIRHYLYFQVGQQTNKTDIKIFTIPFVPDSYVGV